MRNRRALAGSRASSRSSREERDTRLTAIRGALAKYFLGSAAVVEKFWHTNNPSLGDKSPANLAKAGKLEVLEQYITYLRERARSVKPEFNDKPIDDNLVVFDGGKEDTLEKLKQTPAGYGVITISFPDPESYYTYAPLFRRILDRLPETVRRHQRRQQLLLARLLFSFTADLPITIPKSKVLSQLIQRETARKRAQSGSTMPHLPEMPRRRVHRE